MQTLIGIIGKPGAGKTSVGVKLQEILLKSKHFSFGEVLKKMEPTYATDGFSPEGVKKVYEYLISEIQDTTYFIVDWNPYFPQGFYFITRLEEYFGKIITIHLVCGDAVAVERLESRKRRVLLAHEGSVYQDRVTSFNTLVLPEIEKSKAIYTINEINTETKTPDEIVKEIIEIL